MLKKIISIRFKAISIIELTHNIWVRLIFGTLFSFAVFWGIIYLKDKYKEQQII